MKKIPLTNGKLAIVDDEDFRFLEKFNWYAKKDTSGYFTPVMRIHTTSGAKNRKKKTIYLTQFLIKNNKGSRISHKNRDFLDCRKENLFLTSVPHSIQNAKKRKNTKSKYKGVTVLILKSGRVRFAAQVCKHGRHYCLGRFDDEEEAALAYNQKARELYGNFAFQNEV